MARLTKAQKALKGRLSDAAPFLYIPAEWDRKLWSKSSKEIYLYIEDRMNTTEDETEYYTCLVYLKNHLPDTELLVEWADSSNRARMAATYAEEYVDESPTYDAPTLKVTRKPRKAKQSKSQPKPTEHLQIVTCIPLMEYQS